MNSTGSGSDWFSGTAAATAGLGILTFTLFPFAIPFVLLTIAFVLPLALPLIVLAAVGAILTAAWRGLRAAARGIRKPSWRPATRPMSPWAMRRQPDHGHGRC